MISFIAAASDIGIGEALGNMVVGLGVVFLALIFLSGIISLFKLIGKGSKKAAPAKAPVKAAAAPAVAAPKEDAVDGAVIAAILAAVAQKCGPGARVTSIEKAK